MPDNHPGVAGGPDLKGLQRDSTGGPEVLRGNELHRRRRAEGAVTANPGCMVQLEQGLT